MADVRHGNAGQYGTLRVLRELEQHRLMPIQMAIEIGLHYEPATYQAASDQGLDDRRRVFWIAYAIELSLAYNLGRPPSIGDEHITARLPAPTSETALGIHLVKHRQIQSRIVSQVYCCTSRTGCMPPDERRSVILRLQAELEEWKAALPVVCQSGVASWYPLMYSSPYPPPTRFCTRMLTRRKDIGDGSTTVQPSSCIDRARCVLTRPPHRSNSAFGRPESISIAWPRSCGTAMFPCPGCWFRVFCSPA